MIWNIQATFTAAHVKEAKLPPDQAHAIQELTLTGDYKDAKAVRKFADENWPHLRIKHIEDVTPPEEPAKDGK